MNTIIMHLNIISDRFSHDATLTSDLPLTLEPKQS